MGESLIGKAVYYNPPLEGSTTPERLEIYNKFFRGRIINHKSGSWFEIELFEPIPQHWSSMTFTSQLNHLVFIDIEPCSRCGRSL